MPHAGHGTPLPVFSTPPPSGPATSQPVFGASSPPGIFNGSELLSLHSHADASLKLYLDFNGHFEPAWGAFNDIDIPAYDSDGDPSSFGDFELINIVEIWRRVAEDYAPFDIDVTTEAPENFDDTAHLRVAIGGDGAWTDGANAGISYVNLFADAIPNVVFVFPDNLGNGNAKLVADCISHESGHAFGLEHQSLYDDDGNLIDEYNPGDLARAPIMGDSYAAQRGVWWHGPSDESVSQLQDDMSILAAAIGWRADDVGDTQDSARALTVNQAIVAGAGIIGKMDDLDVWSFDTDEGAIMLQVTVPVGINNLDARAQLLDAEGDVVVAWQDPESAEVVTLVTTVASGSYRLVVGSHGAYGDVGQYSISGVIVPMGSVVTPPTELSVEIVSPTEIDLTWQDNADDETGYVVEWSLDGAAWNTLAELDADAAEFTAAGLNPATMYHYQVYAVSDLAMSAISNQAEALTPPAIPAAPTDLAAVAVAFDRIELVWTDNADNESGYVVERGQPGSSWTTIATLAANAGSYQDKGLHPTTTYLYRVHAINDGVVSDESDVIRAVTLPLPPKPPTGLRTFAVRKSLLSLVWSDNSDNETHYKVLRSRDGVNWLTVGYAAANAQTFKVSKPPRGQTYFYTVVAVNAGGESLPSNVMALRYNTVLARAAALSQFALKRK